MLSHLYKDVVYLFTLSFSVSKNVTPKFSFTKFLELLKLPRLLHYQNLRYKAKPMTTSPFCNINQSLGLTLITVFGNTAFRSNIYNKYFLPFKLWKEK